MHLVKFGLILAEPEEVEALVDTLTIEGATLNDAQLSALSGCDLQQLAELSKELHLTNEISHQGKALFYLFCVFA